LVNEIILHHFVYKFWDMTHSRTVNSCRRFGWPFAFIFRVRWKWRQ